MTKIKIAFIATSLFLLTASSQAQNQGRYHTTYGGLLTCEELDEIKEKYPDIYSSAQSWTFGFITGLNAMKFIKFTNPPDGKNVWQEVERVCQNNPSQFLEDAAKMAWINMLGKYKFENMK